MGWASGHWLYTDDNRAGLDDHSDWASHTSSSPSPSRSCTTVESTLAPKIRHPHLLESPVALTEIPAFMAPASSGRGKVRTSMPVAVESEVPPPPVKGLVATGRLSVADN